MANRIITKVTVKSEVIEGLIRPMSIKEFCKEIGYSESTFRKGLRNREMSYDLVIKLVDTLGVKPSEIADVDSYFRKMGGMKFKIVEI